MGTHLVQGYVCGAMSLETMAMKTGQFLIRCNYATLNYMIHCNNK
jgi:hypothetical protein